MFSAILALLTTRKAKWIIGLILVAIVAFFGYRTYRSISNYFETNRQNAILVEKQAQQIKQMQETIDNNLKETEAIKKSGEVDIKTLDKTISQINETDKKKKDHDIKIEEKIILINESYKSLPKDSVREKERRDRISQVRIDSLWETYCTNQSDPECLQLQQE